MKVAGSRLPCSIFCVIASPMAKRPPHETVLVSRRYLLNRLPATLRILESAILYHLKISLTLKLISVRWVWTLSDRYLSCFVVFCRGDVYYWVKRACLFFWVTSGITSRLRASECFSKEKKVDIFSKKKSTN